MTPISYYIKFKHLNLQVTHDMALCYLFYFPLLPNMFPFLELCLFSHVRNKPSSFLPPYLNKYTFLWPGVPFFFPLTQIISTLQENCPCLLCPLPCFLFSLTHFNQVYFSPLFLNSYYFSSISHFLSLSHLSK